MRVLSSQQELSELHGCVLVPTMGALHGGHIALVRRAAWFGRPIVVSIFVNPTQFGPGEDYERYPRRPATDVEAAAAAGADFAFVPALETMYPPDAPPPVPALPAIATDPGLEDARRPDHFAGVCQVVARLFDLTQPQYAVFGEKDFQQLRVIGAMVEAGRDRWPDLEIIGHATVREPDGLAMSSRNAFLSADDRKRALGLSRALAAARREREPRAAERAMAETLSEHALSIDYAVVRDARTLMPIDAFDRRARALIAARVGNVRLIDNA